MLYIYLTCYKCYNRVVDFNISWDVSLILQNNIMEVEAVTLS